ncbi:MAG: hypothetical protein Q8R57_13410 [Bacteroidota bacterium]|nr:hypothetical protein [Bacteroidota bacterium]
MLQFFFGLNPLVLPNRCGCNYVLPWQKYFFSTLLFHLVQPETPVKFVCK